MTPYTNNVLVLRDPNLTEKKTAGGILLVHDQAKREGHSVILRGGTVKAVGVFDGDYKNSPALNPNDHIYYNPFDAHEVPKDDPSAEDTYDLVPLVGIRGYTQTQTT